MSNIKVLTLTGFVASANNISLAQTTGGAANLTITGALASAGVATLPAPAPVSFASTGNISTVTFTVTGTDQYGYAQTDTVTGINNTTVATTKYFKTVTRIAASGTVGTNVTVGTNGISVTPWYPGDYRTGKPSIITIALSTGAVLTYTVEFTPTNLNDQALSIDAQKTQAQNATVFVSTDTAVVAASTNQATNFLNGMPGMRVKINTYTSGTITMTIISPDNHVA